MVMQLRPYQTEAVAAVYDHLRHREDHPCVVLPTGCHAIDHPILMYDGSMRAVQDVRVGDLIMGNDSTPRRVLALCRGRERMYRIVPHRGDPFVVNASHILSLVSTNEGKGQFACQQRGGELTNITVREYLTRSKSWRHLRKLYRVAVDYPHSVDLPIPPYILGLLLGDGHLADGVTLTSADEELGDEFIRYAHTLGCDVSIHETGPRVPSYQLVKRNGKTNILINALREMGLYEHLSDTKFIPQAYLTADRDQRFQMLAGLIDSDGHLDGKGIDYITKSKELAGDLAQLARSLGYQVTIVQKYCSCQTGAGGWFFRLHIAGDFSLIPCRRKRHVKVQHPRMQKKDVLRSGFTVEELPEDEFYGFALDGNHLYVDGNFFVHHNTGKSLVLGQIASDAVTRWNGRVIILAHVRELLEQNADKIRALCPNVPVGIYSAGLKSRDTEHSIIVAGIQSVYRRACDLGPADLTIVDECHRIPLGDDGEGMYRAFLADSRAINPGMRVIGFTATPYRLQGGPICGPENILNHICYEAGLREMIAHGYLCPLKSKAGRHKADTSGLHIRGGEFVAGEVEALMDEGALVRSACREIVEQTADRHAVLIFAAGVQHCRHVAAEITRVSGQECGMVTGDTPHGERDELLRRFRGEHVQHGLFDSRPPLKYLVNCQVLTHGFDAPNVDCVVLLRPTNSAGLYVQMVGRATRLHPGKKDALVLDYGGNILRHGPVDAIEIKDRSGGNGEAPARECPQCRAVIHAAYSLCPDCGYAFPPPERGRHDRRASDADILSGAITESEHAVQEIRYAVHVKRGAPEDHPRSLRVDYRIGLGAWQSEWVCVEHDGFARAKAEAWWRERSREPFPGSAEEAVRICEDGGVADAQAITVRTVAGVKYGNVVRYQLGPIPPRLDGTDEVDGGDLATCPEPDEDEIPF